MASLCIRILCMVTVEKVCFVMEGYVKSSKESKEVRRAVHWKEHTLAVKQSDLMTVAFF